MFKKKIVHNKLVRDKIPDILLDQGKAFKACNHKFLGDRIKLLSSKLVEEAEEVEDKVYWFDHLSEVEPISIDEEVAYQNAVTEELADVYEVFTTLSKLLGINQLDIEKVAAKKKEERGGFEKGVYLEWVEK